jgi:predicted AlkP superfamily pyrophosphatase or phosphodiesterase
VTARLGTLFIALVGVIGSLSSRPAAAQSSDPFFLGSFAAGGSGWVADPDRPRLVVVLVLDQFRGDYPDRFDRAFTSGGFRRLRDGGFDFSDCTIPYAQTLTGPGFATVLTGATPRVHGIVGNAWYERAARRTVVAAADSTVRPIPAEAATSASPRRLRAQAVGDVLRGVSRGVAKVVSISEKDRSAVLAGGHHPTAVFWLDEERMQMQSSSYYTSALPGWATAANATARPESALARPWEPLLEPLAYLGTVPTEGVPGFPHRAEARGEWSAVAALAEMPFGLTSLFAFAKAAIDGEQLGADPVPDLLVLGVSVTDYVGHTYGPDSPEVLDMAARTDREIAVLLDHLDRRVGRDRYAVALTSDHGVSPIAAMARSLEASSADSVGGIETPALRAWADSVLGAAGNDGSRARRHTLAIVSGQVYLDPEALRASGLDLDGAARALAAAAPAHPSLARGFTRAQLECAGDGDFLERAVRRGYDADRGGDVVLVPRPFAFFGGRTTGASHGTPYRYDTHVPFVLFGAGVRRGASSEPVSTLDIAPTLAALLGVPPPTQCEGRPRWEALRVTPRRARR